MNAHRVETVIRQDRTVVLMDLPFRAGEPVEIMICHRASKRRVIHCVPVKYLNPTEPMAREDWSLSQ